MSIDPDSHPTRRERLVNRRRRYRWAGILLASVIVGAAGTVAAFAYTEADAPTTDPQVLTGVATPDGDQDAATSTVPPGEEVAVRPLSHAQPLRLWIGGDSLAGALGPALGNLAGATGVVDTHVDYKVSSGLDPGVRDWPEYAETAMRDKDPEAVVFMIGTNDATLVNSQDANDDGVEDWEPAYRVKVDEMMDLLVGGDAKRTVIWIGAPTMRDDARDEAVVELNRVMREEAARRAPYVMYVDAYALFGDEDGAYTDRVEIDGEAVRVRVGDGVHLTPAGADYLAAPVFALLDGRFHVGAQADLANPLGFTMQQGGESTSSGSGSRNGNSGNGNSGSGSGSSGNNRRTTTTTASAADETESEPTPTTTETAPPDTSPPSETTTPPAIDPPAPDPAP